MCLFVASHIQVDEFQNTSVAGIHALGDVCGNLELTPVRGVGRCGVGCRLCCLGIFGSRVVRARGQ